MEPQPPTPWTGGQNPTTTVPHSSSLVSQGADVRAPPKLPLEDIEAPDTSALAGGKTAPGHQASSPPSALVSCACL